jgi:hypothetical protein
MLRIIFSGITKSLGKRAFSDSLLEDYRDYLRVRDLQIRDKDRGEALYVRKLSKTTPLTFDVFREFVETRPAEVVANIASV